MTPVAIVPDKLPMEYLRVCEKDVLALLVLIVTALPKFAVEADSVGWLARGVRVNVPEDEMSKKDPSGFDPAVHRPDMVTDFVPSALWVTVSVCL